MTNEKLNQLFEVHQIRRLFKLPCNSNCTCYDECQREGEELRGTLETMYIEKLKKSKRKG